MTRKRIRGKFAAAVTTLAIAATLPGSALATHGNKINPHTCDPQVAPGCPAFDVSMSVGVQNAVAGSPTAIQFNFGQPDRSMPVMKADYYLPKGWRFAGLSDLDAAGTAQNCSDLAPTGMYNATGGFSQAEGLGADTGMRVIHNTPDDLGFSQDGYISRNNPRDEYEDTYIELYDPAAENGTVRDYGVRNPGGAEGTRAPSVVFLDWNGTTARICYYHRNNPVDARARDYRQTALLTRLSDDPLFDWKFSVDVGNVMTNAFMREAEGSLLSHHVGLPALTAGNWNRHPVTGTLSRAAFSTAPATAGTYTMRGVFSTCAESLDPTTASGCTNDALVSRTIDQATNILPAEDALRHEYGVLTGPKTAGLCNNSLCPMGLLLGEDAFMTTWSQPLVAAGTAVKGYVLVIAEPGQQGTRVFKRIITNPDLASDPDYDAAACAESGCSLDLSFPMTSSDGSTTLAADRKYSLALVTMYTDTPRRSDGVCDNPTGATEADRGAGTPCPSSVPEIKVFSPGYSALQVLFVKHAYPHVFVETWDDTNNSTYDGLTNRLLLVDFDLKQTEFILWNTNDQVTRYFARTNTIVGANGIGGVVVAGSQTIGGPTRNWQIAVEVGDPFFGAVGTVLFYDLKNPGLTPPAIAGLPEVEGIDDSTFLFLGSPL